MAGRTTITIAHRLSTIRGADQIAVLDRGRVVEQGDHDALVSIGGRYATLLETRASSLPRDGSAQAAAGP